MISTSKEQSLRLIRCGVQPESADMTLYSTGDPMVLYWGNLPQKTINIGVSNLADDVCSDYRPSWSLTNLLGMLPRAIHEYRLVMGPDEAGWCLEYNDASVTRTIFQVKSKTLIECVVQAAEWMSHNGHKLNGLNLKNNSKHD